MNQRIALIAEQAKKSVPHGLGVDKWIETYNQLFAKLIVEECLDILDDEDNGELDTRSVRIAAIRIKKLFGVEE